MSERILLVDDDANILQGYQRRLRKRYDITIALCADEGLRAIREDGPFAVVVSDMRMPGLDGVQFLARVREQSASTVRMMLTGNADQQTAIDAVNQGNIFRFLNKPCETDALGAAIDACLEQHRLINAERELLTKTLGGCVSLLTEVLSLVNPTAFGRATNVRRLAKRIGQHLDVPNAWEIEIAAMLSQLGCVTVAESTLDGIARGIKVPDVELAKYREHPKVGHDLLVRIPRLSGVARIIAYQEKRFDGGGLPAEKLAGEDIPLGARILKLALNFDAIRQTGQSDEQTLAVLRERSGSYDPLVVEALAAVLGAEYVVRSVMLSELTDDMTLDEHVMTHAGEILVAKGKSVNTVLRKRLTAFTESSKTIREPIRVRCPMDAPPPDTAASRDVAASGTRAGST